MDATPTDTETAIDLKVANLIGKMRRIEREIARTQGHFNLFGLFEREDTPGRWDVVVSAHWLKPGYEGILTITRFVSTSLSPEEAVLIARIVPLPPQSEFVRTINRMAHETDKGFLSTGRLSSGTGEIEHGYILASQIDGPRIQQGGRQE